MFYQLHWVRQHLANPKVSTGNNLRQGLARIGTTASLMSNVSGSSRWGGSESACKGTLSRGPAAQAPVISDLRRFIKAVLRPYLRPLEQQRKCQRNRWLFIRCCCYFEYNSPSRSRFLDVSKSIVDEPPSPSRGTSAAVLQVSLQSAVQLCSQRKVPRAR